MINDLLDKIKNMNINFDSNYKKENWLEIGQKAFINYSDSSCSSEGENKINTDILFSNNIKNNKGKEKTKIKKIKNNDYKNFKHFENTNKDILYLNENNYINNHNK